GYDREDLAHRSHPPSTPEWLHPHGVLLPRRARCRRVRGVGSGGCIAHLAPMGGVGFGGGLRIVRGVLGRRLRGPCAEKARAESQKTEKSDTHLRQSRSSREKGAARASRRPC